MNKMLLRKSLLIVAIAVAAVLVLLRKPLSLGLDLRGGNSLILRVNVEGTSSERIREAVEQTRQILEKRVNAYGLSETSIQRYGSQGNELLVQVPGVGDLSRVKGLLQSRGLLEWYSVEGGPYSTPADAAAEFGGVVPYSDKLMATKQSGERMWYVLRSQPVIRGTDLRDARTAVDSTERPVTTFDLTADAAARFQKYTAANIGKRSAIVLDGEILSVPVIEDVIRDSGEIRGAKTVQEAEDLAVELRSGALPASIELMQQHTVEASLGTDSVHRGLIAGAAGLAAVVATMLLYYRWAGANATLALALNGLLLLAALSCFGAVLTMPGIAGVVLTIGMAVDSNVLIFERIREELRTGKSVSAALGAGFYKAFATLVDTHVTTVVSCLFLFSFGTPPVKGFATTLVLGLVTNLFTSVFVSRVAFDWELAMQGRTAKLNLGMSG
ncbi:MAG TPA: protein translocase subunit SecD [Terriglobales bacterium]|nr:protein translocase subunit SecD [Terriglobales bacterium]